MGQEPMRDPASQVGQEAILERYIERPSRLHDWFERRIRQAPWWCISLLVHIIALLALWSWPAKTAAEHEVFIIDGGLIPYDPPEPEPPKPPVLPPDPPPLPPDFKIKDVQETLVAGGGDPTEPEPVKDPEPPIGSPEGRPDEPVLDSRLALIAIEFEPIHTRPQDGLGFRRGKLRDAIERRGRWPGPGDGPGTDIVTVVPPLIAALNWLKRAQEPNGSWNARKWDATSSYDVGMTGLALLAFQGAGFTHTKGTYRDTVYRALNWLGTNQRDNGSFQFETFYEQGIATMAVCEAYGLTKDPRLRPMAQRAVSFIVGVQPEHGGFRYGGAVPLGEGDMSVTGWQVMALKSALLAQLTVPDEAIERCRTFLKNSLREYGASAYIVNDKAPGSLAISSIGLLCRIFLNDAHAYDAEIGQGVQYLTSKETPDLNPAPGGASKQLVADIYYTYYSSLAMFLFAGEGSEHWRAWRTMYRAPLIAAQVHDEADARGRFVKGSWDPAKHRWGDRGGRVYATAMGALCLEAPFRFLPTSQPKQ
ncbi:MAG: terpene cyclase/mutase family protein [Planctomycetes bacterium]|nr:terpene cyclase/mutase family protein [Planctomycetota bacterium]